MGSDVERMVITRIVNAPREIVWQAWTDPKCVAAWWGPQGFTTPVCRIDLRVGRKFLFCMRMPDGQEGWTGGEYHEIVPLEKIVFSMYFADADGNRVEPEQYGITHEAIADVPDTVTFEDLGDGRTKLTYTGNETMRDAVASGQMEGMNQSLDKLAGVIVELARPS